MYSDLWSNAPSGTARIIQSEQVTPRTVISPYNLSAPGWPNGGNYFVKLTSGLPGVYSTLTLTIPSSLATSFSTLSVSFLMNYFAGDYSTAGDEGFYTNATSFMNSSSIVSNVTMTSAFGLGPAFGQPSLQFNATGWRFFANVILPAAEIHTLQFGVRNVGDARGNSSIYIDNVNVCLVATPTPTSTLTPSSTPAPTNFVFLNRYGFETNSSGFNNVSTYFGFQNCTLEPWFASDNTTVAVVSSALNYRGDTILPRTGNCMAKITAGIVNVQNAISLNLFTRTRTNFSFDYMFVPLDESTSTGTNG